VAFSPSGAFLAVTNADEAPGAVLVFAVDPSTGALREVPGSPFPVGFDPTALAFSPSGASLAVTNANSAPATVQVFAVDPSTGALREVRGSPVPVGFDPTALAFSPSGAFLAVTNAGGPNVVDVFFTAPAPIAVIGAPANGSTYGVNELVDTSFSCDDAGGPGLESCSDSTGTSGTNGTLNGALDTSTVGTHSYSVTAMSVDGQHGNATVSYTVLPRQPQIDSPQVNATYVRGQLVAASYDCPTGGTPPPGYTCLGTVRDGSPIDTAQVGTHTFQVTAAANGLSTTSTITYTVVYPKNHFTISHVKPHRNGVVTLDVKAPGSGTVDILETAWEDNLARMASLLQPAPGRFVFARGHASTTHATTLALRIVPNRHGIRLVHHHAYRVTLRLWVTYTPKNGLPRSLARYALHLPPIRAR
jgi:DNA-binding beta-propeller fold protein YncE